MKINIEKIKGFLKNNTTSIIVLIVAISAIKRFFTSDFIIVKTISLGVIAIAVYYTVNFEKEFTLQLKQVSLQNLESLKQTKILERYPEFFHKIFSIIKELFTKISDFLKTHFWQINTVSYIFLTGLILITYSSFKSLPLASLITNLQSYVIVITLISGIATFWINKEKTNLEVEKENNDETLAEEKREEEFGTKFPTINKIPVLRTIVKWMYKEGFVYLLGLFLILIIFTLIKQPYFNISFAGAEHTLKYNAYIEAAQSMKQEKNIFYYTKHYSANPLEPTSYIQKTFPYPPIIEWGLLSLLYFFPNNTIEFNTRLFMQLVGFCILILAYFGLKIFLNKKQSLILTLLLCVNPIFIFSTFLPNQEIIGFLFMFVVLVFLHKFFYNEKFKTLFFASIFLGIGIASRLTLFIYFIPISLGLFIIKIKHFENAIKWFIQFSIISIISYLIYIYSLLFLPSRPLLSVLIFLLLLIVLRLIYLLFSKNQNCLLKISKKIILYKYRVFSIIIMTLLLISYIIYKYEFLIPNVFFPDLKLLLDLNVYKFIIINQIQSYIGPIYLYTSIICILLYFLINFKRFKLIITFLFSSLLFTMITINSLYLHNYYTLIILFSLLVPISYFIFDLNILYKKYIYKIFIFLTISLLFIIPSIKSGQKILSFQRPGFNETVNFIIKNTDKNDMFLIYNGIAPLAIKTNRVFLFYWGTFMNEERIRTSIQKKGFASTLGKYNIKYFITTDKEIDYLRFANFFSDDQLMNPEENRTDDLLNRTYKNIERYSDKSIRLDLINRYNIKNKFELVFTSGIFKIYSFKN